MPRGLAAALMKPGLTNHGVQLVEMDLRQLDAINTVVAAAVKGLTPFFSNCVDIVYAPTPLAEGRLSWAQLLLQAATNRSIAYGQILGDHNASVAGQAAILAYAAAPPVGGQPRDFVYRTITFD